MNLPPGTVSVCHDNDSYHRRHNPSAYKEGMDRVFGDRPRGALGQAVKREEASSDKQSEPTPQ